MDQFELTLKGLPIYQPSTGYFDRVLAERPRPVIRESRRLLRRPRIWLSLSAALVVLCMTAVFNWPSGEVDREVAKVQVQATAPSVVERDKDTLQFDMMEKDRADLPVDDLQDKTPQSALPSPLAAERIFRYPAFSEGLAATEGPLAEGAAPVGKSCSSALGYMDIQGAWVIEPRFRQAEDFAGGVARVQDADGQPYYYIDHTGQRVPEEVVKQLEPKLKVFKENGKYGYVDTRSGKIVVEAKYDEAHAFSEGLAFVCMFHEGGTRYIDKTGREVIPPDNLTGRDFHEGLAAAARNGSGKWGFIDQTGKFVIPPRYDETYSFSEGLAKVRKDGKYGFIDVTGKVVIPLKYRSSRGFSEGLAAVRLSVEEAKAAGLPWSETGWTPWGYIDHSGKFVSPQRFSTAEPFKDGVAYVSQSSVTPEGFRGFINRAGVHVLDRRGPSEKVPAVPSKLPVPLGF
jgi:hypothetical protein